MTHEATVPAGAAEPPQRATARIALSLVADDAVAAAVERELTAAWRVRRTADLPALRQAVARERPDVVLVDAAELGEEPHRAAASLRADFRTAGLPLVAVVPATTSVAALLELGDVVDDFVSVPAPAGELGRRLAWSVRRNADVNPMAAFTGLPGLLRARQELLRRMTTGEVFAYCHLDLDGFAAFNQVYGYDRGDQLILALAATLRRVSADLAPEPFIGHVSGDDFVLICDADQARPACRDVADMFEADSLRLYDDAERARGALEVVDRRGHRHEVPLTTVSVGVATNEHRAFDSAHHVASIALEMLVFAKRSRGSSVGVDRRKA